MSSENKFIATLPDGAKQTLSGALNHIMEHSEHKLPPEAGSAISINDLPDEEVRILSSAIYQAVRNHRIRIHFSHLRQRGLTVQEACKVLGEKVNLDIDYIRNIAYRK